jgi:hypothetical protein
VYGASKSGRCAVRGQAMIESCLVIIFLCLLFLGLFQMAHAYVAREVLNHAAARAARAKTVGFNRWMVEKTMRVAAIPNAGRLLVPSADGNPEMGEALNTMGPGALWDFALQSTPRAASLDTELARIPEYLASEDEDRAENLLDYENWSTVSSDIDTSAGIILDPTAAGYFTARTYQSHELLLALDALREGTLDENAATNGSVRLIGRYDIEAHYPLYLDDQNW